MAVIVPTAAALGNGRLAVTWAGMVTGDSGAWANLKGYRDKTVTVEGTATTFALQGTNDPDGGNPRTLEDVDFTTAITAVGVYVLKENPLLIRPLLTTGSVTVEIVADR